METHFSVQKKKYHFLFRAFLPVNGNYYLNYRKAYLKFMQLATMFFDFSDIPADVSSSSV